jgi:hypothetical protein
MGALVLDTRHERQQFAARTNCDAVLPPITDPIPFEGQSFISPVVTVRNGLYQLQ